MCKAYEFEYWHLLNGSQVAPTPMGWFWDELAELDTDPVSHSREV